VKKNENNSVSRFRQEEESNPNFIYVNKLFSNMGLNVKNYMYNQSINIDAVFNMINNNSNAKLTNVEKNKIIKVLTNYKQIMHVIEK